MSSFHVYKDIKGEFRWRFVATNGKIIAVSSEGYTAKKDCEHGIDLLKKEAAGAPVHDETDKK